MRKLNIIIVILLLSANIYAQRTGLTIGAGIGTYQLNDLKLFQDELIALAPVSANGFTYFPPYSHIQVELFRKNLKLMKYGLSYSYSTTGAHANYSDYSGIMNIDQNIEAHQLGAAIFYPLVSKEYFEISPYGRLMIAYTQNWATREISTIFKIDNLGARMRTISPAAEVGLETVCHLKNYSLGIEAGYQYDVGGNMKIAKNDVEAADLFLPDRQLRSNISGLRIIVKLAIRFDKEISIE